MEIIIRRVNESDYESWLRFESDLLQVHVDGNPEFFNQPTPDILSKQMFNSIIEKPENFLIFAEFEGNVIGYLFAAENLRSQAPTLKTHNTLVMQSFIVKQEFRKHGIGKQLMDKAKEHAREKGIETMALNVWNFNTRSIKFYQDVGFIPLRQYMEMSI